MALPASERLIAANTGRRIAVVCHGGVINAWAALVLGIEPRLFFDPRYTSINRFMAARSGERSLVSLNETAQKLRGLLMGYATDLELDGHNRVLIPKEHREFVGLDSQAMMFGQGNKFEVWDEGRWNEQLSRWMDSGSADSADLTAELETLSY